MTERDFGAWLRQLRLQADLTQEALAEVIGCATQTMRSFESGRRRPSREMAVRLTEYFHLPPSERDTFIRLARTTAANEEVVAPVPASPINPGNLTLPSDPLIGRDTELQQLRHAFFETRARLVTLLGPGGVGKTRLALQAAADLASSFADGVALVALEQVHTYADMVVAMATSVGCQLAPGQSPEAMLLNYLPERNQLLVLDTFEHLLSAEQGAQVRTLLAQMLHVAPGITLLITSRKRLRLQAEHIIELHGLALPGDDQPDSISRSDAVLLFVERARRAKSRFVLTTQNQSAVAEICRRLEGIPLALELAAAQVLFLPPTLLLARLDQILPLLEGSVVDAPERQRTMHATISWSYNLLDDTQRLVFQRLAVIGGGFDLETAESVAGGGLVEPTQVIGVLRQLVDQSLLVHEEPGAEHARYRFHEVVRHYALECLEKQPEEGQVVRERHAAYFIALAKTANTSMRGSEQAHWVERLANAFPDLCAAMAWLLTQGDFVSAANFGYTLWPFLWVQGHLGEGLRWTDPILAGLPNIVSTARGRALLTASVLAYGQANYVRALALAETSLEQYRALGDSAGIALGVTMVGLAAGGMGFDAKATQFIEKGVALHLAAGDTWTAAMALTHWGRMLRGQGQFRRAAVLDEQALKLIGTSGSANSVSSAHDNLAFVAETKGTSFYEGIPSSVAVAVSAGTMRRAR